MKYIFTESQLKKIVKSEVETKSDIDELKLTGIVADFLDEISDFEDLEGMAKSMGFVKYGDMVDFIRTNGYRDFTLIRKEAYEYIQQYNK